jgi:catechol-2,3-dioxygenase
LLINSASVGTTGLIVSDFRRSPSFYAGVIGLEALSQTNTSAHPGVVAGNRVLLELEGRPGVHPQRSKRLGLYTPRY